MCIAIYKPAGVTISKDTLAQCFRANPDGAGFMFNKDRRLHVQKGFFSFNEFWEAYEEHQEEQCVIHFRIKTHGKVNVENCHPFLITTNVGFVHNGIIPGYGYKDFSDTYHFNERILKRLVTVYGRRTVFDDIIQELIEDFIGYSKLIFLDNLGNFYITNETKGEWKDGVWYSNSSYKIPTYTHTPSYARQEPKVTVIHPPQSTAIIPQGSLVIKKANGLDIEEGDWVEIKYDTRGLRKGDWVNVIKIYRDNTADIEDSTGQSYAGISGAYLEHPEYSAYEVPDYSAFRDN